MISKYKLVGYIQTFLGVIQIGSILMQIIFVLPQINDMYSSMDIETGLNAKIYLGLFLGLLFGALYLLFGLINLDVILPEKKEKLFVIGLVYIAVAVFLTRISYMATIIQPIYNITSSL